MRFTTVSTVSTIVTLLSTASAWKCEFDDTRYINQVATLVPTIQTHPANATMNMTVSGTLRVTDACNFVVENFTYTPYINETFWYGVRDETYNKGKISNETVLESLGNETVAFRFVDYPIARGWDDIDTLILFSPTYNVEIARASLNLTEIQRIRNNTTPTENDDDTIASPSPSSTPVSSSARQSTVPGGNVYVMLACYVILGFLF